MIFVNIYKHAGNTRYWLYVNNIPISSGSDVVISGGGQCDWNTVTISVAKNDIISFSQTGHFSLVDSTYFIPYK